MVDRRLRYSERKRLASHGSLADLSDEPTVEFRRAVIHAIHRITSGAPGTLGRQFLAEVQDECEEHFGWSAAETAASYASQAALEDFLDYFEILVEVA